MIDRRSLIKSAAAAGLVGGLNGCTPKKAAGKGRPNIIIFLSDDQGYGDFGAFGNAGIDTPNLDRLAGEGVMLTQHYSGSPLCAPARAALLTGRYNNRTGALCVESNRGMDRIALEEETFADVFKRAGYRTGMIGKWHNGLFDMRFHPNNRGFEEFMGFMNGGMDYWDWILDYNGKPRFTDGRYLTDVFTDEAVGFIDRHRDEPFILYVAYNAPHSPLQAPEELVQKYMSTGRYNETVSTIYAMIERMDEGVGRIMGCLSENGLDDNTVVMFTSDNGPWLGQIGDEDYMRYNGPFSGMKNFVLEGGIRVPAIVRWPAGLPAGRQCHEMVHFTDWLPTFMAAAGLSVKPKLPLDGMNVLDILRGQRKFDARKLFWQHNRNEPICNCNSAMRDGPWKLTWPYPAEARYKSPEDNRWYFEQFERPHFETSVQYLYLHQDVPIPDKPMLYNVEMDPSESEDLAEKYPERLAKMQSELENWFDDVESERRSRGLFSQ